MEIVQRIQNGEKIAALAEEFGIHRKLLYEWKRRVDEGGASNLRGRGRPRKSETTGVSDRTDPRQIAEMERTIAHQQLIIEFFRHALQRVEELRQNIRANGATASFKPSGL
jgi:transposase-like protein